MSKNRVGEVELSLTTSHLFIHFISESVGMKLEDKIELRERI